MAVGNMFQRGYPSYSMTGIGMTLWWVSVLPATCTYLAATSLMKRSAHQFSSSSRYKMRIVIQRDFPFVNGRARQATLFGESTCKCHLGTLLQLRMRENPVTWPLLKLAMWVEIGIRGFPRNNNIYYYGLRCSDAFFANAQMPVYDNYLWMFRLMLVVTTFKCSLPVNRQLRLLKS